ncbi:hypothetical protein [Engelhardtia mirabilis]|uniref:Uncharacterized protein n=1 Tax=Engelhardtia mirabilis TaxID=2528011 RepID=A0A518BIP7_9BACT|nr:hypothetical protein Pla133_18990 [Planctomycetes bacterium Pla133]QDV01149.1 hypothetical protein Pla86_18980 [Planctomycetes bacterium Pla86]
MPLPATTRLEPRTTRREMLAPMLGMRIACRVVDEPPGPAPALPAEPTGPVVDLGAEDRSIQRPAG